MKILRMYLKNGFARQMGTFKKTVILVFCTLLGLIVGEISVWDLSIFDALWRPGITFALGNGLLILICKRPKAMSILWLILALVTFYLVLSYFFISYALGLTLGAAFVFAVNYQLFNIRFNKVLISTTLLSLFLFGLMIDLENWIGIGLLYPKGEIVPITGKTTRLGQITILGWQVATFTTLSFPLLAEKVLSKNRSS